MTQFSGNVIKIKKHLSEITTNQLKEWGVRYHSLIFGKQHYDLLIDDKAINSLQVHQPIDILNYLK